MKEKFLLGFHEKTSSEINQFAPRAHTGFGPGGNMYDNNFQKEGGFSAISPICMTKALHTKTVNALAA